mmetsp:Transcript_60270/g.111775  ORF Transcript_60270/g.111775 Transcript_60270/m.111775 type:complete len:442 (+) Transcript_60270:44-1369(+)
MASTFSIYQEPWHACWLAATNRRLRQGKAESSLPDIDVCAVSEQMLKEHGPSSAQPLSLRIYGTLLKGMCILSSSKVLALYGDCERLVSRLAQSNYGNDGKALMLPNTKKTASRPFDLALNISTALEADSFDWTQRPLEYSTVELLAPEPEMTFQEPSLLEEANLIRDEVFPPLPAMLEVMPAGETTGLPQTQDTGSTQADANRMAASMPDVLDAPMGPSAAVQAEQAQEEPAMKRQKLAPTALLLRGRVYGFDAITQAEDGGGSIHRQYYGPAEAAALLFASVTTFERLGSLSRLMQSADKAATQNVFATVTGALANAEKSVGPGRIAPPASTSQGQAFLVGQDDHSVVPLEGVSAKLVGLGFADAVPYDEKSAQVGIEIRECLQNSKDLSASLEQLIPRQTTDKATAALTFASILTLATAGDIDISQSIPYGAIRILAK